MTGARFVITREGDPPRFIEEVQWLSDDNIEPLRRTEELGQALNFGVAVEGLKVIREYLTAFAWMEGKYEPTNFATDVAQHMQAVKRTIDFIRGFDPNENSAATNRVSYQTQIDNERSWFVQNVGPLVRGFENSNAGAMLAELRASRDAVQRAKEEAEAALATIRQAAGEKGTKELAQFFSDQGTNHRDTAKRFLWGVVIGIAALIALGFVFFFWSPIALQPANAADWIEFIRQLLPRLFVLFVLAYVVRFASRSYNVNKHLQVTNETRANILRTFPELVASNSTDEGKDRMAALLATAAVATSDSGFLKAGGDDKGLDSQMLAIAELLRR